MNPLKTGDSLSHRGRDASLSLSLSDKRRAKYPHPDEALMAPIDTKARIKRRWLFHLRAEISFAHLGTCRRRHRRRPDERAQIERILMRTLKRKRFTVALDELTATESVITICYCVIAITRWLLTNRISLHLNTVHATHYRHELSPA